MTTALETPTVVAGAAASTRENLLTMLGGIWLTFGLFIDGYAHSNIITETEDFFTPWHGIFYSGFTVTAAWIGWLMYQRRMPNSIRSWIPSGYGAAVIGVCVFAIGGVGDMFWHTIFGVETDLDALLSPTHLILLLGLVLILAAPLQSVITSGGSPWVAVASLTTLVSLACFFTTFAHPLSSGWVLGIQYSNNNDVWHSLAISGALLATTILVVPVLFFVRNIGPPPFGATAVLWTVPVVLEAVALSSAPVTAGLSAFGGGVTVDLLLRMVKTGPDRYRYLIAMTTGTAVLWTLWVLFTRLLDNPMNWPAELWTGLILASMLIAAALTALAFPTIRMQSSRQDL